MDAAARLILNIGFAASKTAVTAGQGFVYNVLSENVTYTLSIRQNLIDPSHRCLRSTLAAFPSAFAVLAFPTYSDLR